MSASPEKIIFKKASSTFYVSSLFFPRHIRADVFRLYSFARVADDYADAKPPKAAQLQELIGRWRVAQAMPNFDTTHLAGDPLNELVVKNLVYVIRAYRCDPALVEAFLAAMQADLQPRLYQILDDSLWYVYGSAEVVGLLMARVMGLPAEADDAARLQGRAWQWINFIRDIPEDVGLGRSYFPAEELKAFGLDSLTRVHTSAKPEEFKQFITFQLDRYQQWQAEAARGHQYIPRRLRIPVQTAADMHAWTAAQIRRNPFMIYDQKIKPGKRQILRAAVRHLVKG